MSSDDRGALVPSPEAEPVGAGAGFQLQDLVAIVQMQWMVVVGCMAAAIVLALLHGLLATPLYRSTAVLHLSAAAGQEVKADRVVDQDQFNKWNRAVFVQTQLEILRSKRTMTGILDKFATRWAARGKPAVEIDYTELLSMLEVNPRQGTELLDLSITSDDPEKSELLANLVAETYRDQNLVRLQEAAVDAKEWLRKEIDVYREQIEGRSSEMVDFQKEHDLADVDEASNSRNVRMESLNQAFAEINTERVLLETTVWAYERMLAEEKYDELAKELDTPLVASLSADYATALTERAQIAARYGEKMPQRMQAEARLAKILEEIKREVEVSLSAQRKRLNLLRNKEKNLSDEIAAGKLKLLGDSASEGTYENKKLDLERAKEFYVRLNQRYDELQLQAKTQLNNVNIIDLAEPNPRRVSPNVWLNLAVAVVGGLVGGVGLGLLREYVDDTISSPLDVQTFLKVPFLGMIPKISDLEDETRLALFTHENPKSTVAEAMRGIRTVLELDPSGVPPRVLLVTSAVSAEGKTSTVVRLAVAFANLGKRVLAIDADLRRPRLHKVFGVEKDVGLSTLLTGEATVEEAVRSSPVPNLDWLASGRGGERPNELLASPAMPALLDKLGETYDLILIDSPPSVPLSDARILSRYVDGVVLLVREQKTSRLLVREAVVGLLQVRARVLGVIVNAVDLKQRRINYKYHYGYGYGYGQHYGPYGNDKDGDAPAPDDAKPV